MKEYILTVQEIIALTEDEKIEQSRNTIRNNSYDTMPIGSSKLYVGPNVRFRSVLDVVVDEEEYTAIKQAAIGVKD